MVQDLVTLLPKDAPHCAAVGGIAAAAVGLILWLAASRISRCIITLLTVLLGAVIGMQLPRWLGWQVSGAGTAVAAAVVLGVSGFILHRMWVGIGFGAVAAIWTTLIGWICLRNGQAWTWPPVSESNFESYMMELWHALPDSLARLLPFAAAACLITGLALTIIWPKITLALMWSLTGLTLMFIGSLVAINYLHPEWLNELPPNAAPQVVVLGALLGIGGGIQWMISPARKTRKPRPEKPYTPPPTG